LNKQKNGLSKPKILMLGIDAGDIRFIESHLDHLPGFKQLIKEGHKQKLDTTSGLLTGSVWPTFYTGTHPGQHGLYHHLQWDAEAMRIRRVAADWLYSEPFWYELARNGVKVTIVDVPMTFPSRLDAGIEVINWGSHDQLGKFHCNQDMLEKEILKRFGVHPMGAEIPVNKTSGQLNAILRKLLVGAEVKGELVQYLLEATKWDFFLAIFGETHRGGHILWPESKSESVVPEDALLKVYEAVDAALSSILENVDTNNTNVVVFSLHGMQANTSQEHFTAPVMTHINEAFLSSGKSGSRTAARQRSIMRVLRSKVPARLQNGIAQFVSASTRDWVVSRATSAGYEWDKTPGIALLSDFNGYLRLNIKQRETEGYLERGSEQYSRYICRLHEAFRGLKKVDTDEALVEQIILSDDVFPGVRNANLPDLIVRWRESNPAEQVRIDQLGSINAQIDSGRSGNHRHEGFYIASGLAVSESQVDWMSATHIEDFAGIVKKVYL
jgi:predicted AlkP superfamily phosphohydrolase/phosphomutase